MIRTFVAIDLPDGAKDALREVGEHLRRRTPEGSLRWSRVVGIHLTLKFLGDVPETDLPAIKEALAQVARRYAPFTLSLVGLGCFPNLRRPRVVWVGVQVDADGLATLQRDVEGSLAPLGFEPEKRVYHAHLTLGRTQRGVSPADLRRIGDVVADAQVGELGQIRVKAFRLMRSDLRPSGAVYTPLATFPLGLLSQEESAVDARCRDRPSENG